jgi:hypothetical protein
MKTQWLAGMLALALFLVPGVYAESNPNAQSKRLAPRLDEVGQHPFAVTTSSPEAQRFVEQGLALAYGFNHAEAIRSFQEAARLDPNCAMACWGEALALGPNINAPMTEEAARQAWAALQKAQAAAPKASAREQAYIDALTKRYAEKNPQDRHTLDLAYAKAMREVMKKYPDDLDAATLFAEAVMDTTPWDYWTEKKEAKPLTKEAIAALESVFVRNDKHAGANHLYIHLVESGPHPELGLPAAYRLEELAPDAGHLVHMPGHFYLKTGLYHRATMVNERAIAADQSYMAACRRQGFYPAAYYPHNIHFLWYAQMMEGRSEEAIASARKVSNYVTHCRPDAMEKPRQNPLPALTLARFEKWDEVLKEPLESEDGLFEKGLYHYARALAFAAKGNTAEAAKEKAQLDQILASKEIDALETEVLPSKSVLTVASLELDAAQAKAKKDVSAMIAAYEKAVAAQDKLPYMEPPFCHCPIRQVYGEALLQAKKPADAEKVFRADLERTPHNGWSLYGLWQSLAAQGGHRTRSPDGAALQGSLEIRGSSSAFPAFEGERHTA